MYVDIYVLGPKQLWWIFIQIAQLRDLKNPPQLGRSVAHKLFRQFLDFLHLLTAISRNCVTSSDENRNSLALLKGRSLLK